MSVTFESLSNSAISATLPLLDRELARLGRSPTRVSDAERQQQDAARGDLLAFVERTFPQYQTAPHHRLLADHLHQIETGAIRRLMVELPPRHGKSELVSIRFPAWYLGRNPRRRVIASSYAAELAYTFSRQARNLFEHPLWPFPTQLAADARGVEHWATSAGGGYVAAGVGGSITGHGADLLLIDDPVRNREDADSETVRASQWEWYTSTARTRLQPGAAIVLCMTRWHEDDLGGRLLRAQNDGGEQWTVLRLPAIAEEPEDWGSWQRQPGDALWSAWYDAEALAVIERTVGSRNWSALYQQRPTSDEGGLFRRSWWRRYTERPVRLDAVLQSWDLAFKALDSSDYVVGQVWGRAGADCYLLDQVRGRLDFPQTLQAIKRLSAEWPQATAKLVEDAANGPAVIQMLQHTVPGLIAVKPAGGKEARAHAVAPLVEAGNVYLPQAPWVDGLIDECAAFPAGQHDDQVDALTQALLRLGQRHTVTTASVNYHGAFAGQRRR